MSDKDLEWHCHARDSNLQLSVQEIASPCGAMSAHGPILLKKSEYRPDPNFFSAVGAVFKCRRGGLIVTLRLKGASFKSICGGQ